MRKQTYKVTVFKTASSNETATITLERLFKYFQEGRWRNLVDRIRQAMKRGDKKTVDRLKKKLAYVCYSGQFRDGSHAAECLTEYIPYIVLDYDDVDPERLEVLKNKAMTLPGAVMVFNTPSGCGFKVVVLTNAIRAHHAQAYAMVAKYYDDQLEIRCDRSCKDISRGHFVSYDYYAQFNPDAKPFDVESHIKEAEEREASGSGGAPAGSSGGIFNATANAASGGVVSVTSDAVSGNASDKTSGNPSSNSSGNTPTFQLPPNITADEFVRSSLVIFPAVEGERNTRLFRLACEAHHRGFAQEEIARAAIRQMSDDSFDAFEIINVVKSAYSRKDANMSRNREKNEDTKCQLSDQVSLHTKYTTSAPDEDDENPDGEELREHTPIFPESVYAHLPEFLLTALKYTSDSRERDMLLLAILTTTSALMPTTSGFYGKRRMYAYFYTFVVAPAACGKGVMDYALTLCKHFLKDISDENDRLEKKYNEECQAYEKYCKSRKKEGEELSRPEPPVYCFLHIPATVSKSRFLMHLRDNKERGAFIFDLEADTLTATGKVEYGNYFDYLRKISQHETIGDSFKINGKPNYVHCPKLAMLLAGTPAQLCRLIPTSEDGLYSRILFYTHRQQPVWKDVSPCDDEEEVERHFDALGMRLRQMLRFLASSPTRVTLSKAQWRRLNIVFGTLLAQEGISDRDDFQSSIKRYCLTTLRICMVLASLEKATMHMDVREVRCSEENFEAALSITTACLDHSRLLITSLSTSDKDLKELQNPNKMKAIFSRLPELFTLGQFLETAAFFEVQRRTAFKVLKRAIGLYVKKIKKGVYEKLPL